MIDSANQTALEESRRSRESWMASPHAPNASGLWAEVLRDIQSKINRYSFSTWFRSTTLIDDDGQTLAVRVDDDMVADWLERHYADVIVDALVASGCPRVAVRLVPQPLQ